MPIIRSPNYLSGRDSYTYNCYALDDIRLHSGTSLLGGCGGGVTPLQ